MTTKRLSTSAMVRTALLSAVACVLMQIDLRLPIFPGFLGLDVSDVPAVIGAVTGGPLVGFTIVFLKNVMDMIIFGTSTGGIGNAANFVIGAALVVPVGIVYKRSRNNKGYFIGGAIGLVSMVIVACLANYFVLLPLYSRLFMPMETILEVANAVNSNVTNVYSFLLFAIVPFNLLKGGLTIGLGFILYRALRPALASIMTSDKI